MTQEPDTNSDSEEAAAIEALAIWVCNRQTHHICNNGGASSWFHECLPATQESFRKWAATTLNLIGTIRGYK